MVTITGIAAASTPCSVAGCWPKFRISRMPVTLERSAASRSMAAQEPSLLPSSTRITSCAPGRASAIWLTSRCTVASLL